MEPVALRSGALEVLCLAISCQVPDDDLDDDDDDDGNSKKKRTHANIQSERPRASDRKRYHGSELRTLK